MTCGKTVLDTTCVGGFTQSAIGNLVGPTGAATRVHRGKGSIRIINLFSLFVVTLLLIISYHGIYTAFMLFWKKCLLIEAMITDYGMRIQLLSLITTADNLSLIKSWKFSFSSIGFNDIIEIWIISWMQFKSFPRLRHHGICAIIPRSEAEFLLSAHVMFVGVLLDCSQPSIFWYFSIDEQHEGVNRIARELEASAKRKTWQGRGVRVGTGKNRQW